MLKRLFFLLGFLTLTAPLFAQRSNRVSYVNLINRANAPQIFIDDIVLPTEDGKANLSLIFRFENDFLPYKKITFSDEFTAPEGMQYYTIARLSSEIFKGKAGRKGSNIEIATRDLWTDTLFTKTFEETESKALYASGSLTNTLEQGIYNYVLQLSLMESTNERNSNRQNVRIWDWNKKPFGEIYLIEKKTADNKLILMNMDDNVLFGKDFMMLVRIPNYSASNEYSVNISRAQPGRKDTSKVESVFTSIISDEDILGDIIPELTEGKDPAITYKSSNNGFSYALVSVPNSTFENAAYIVEISSKDQKQPVAKGFFKSYWRNMPASLLNLDIAIENMKFIVPESEIKRLKSGDPKEKEQKFRAFWDSKDPTPNTVFNELMAEYFRRVDYAFKEYRNPGNPNGHETDQGEVYIKYGPPNSKDRRFPTNGNVIEVWEYPGRTFVFEKTTGFGDFVLRAAD